MPLLVSQIVLRVTFSGIQSVCPVTALAILAV